MCASSLCRLSRRNHRLRRPLDPTLRWHSTKRARLEDPTQSSSSHHPPLRCYACPTRAPSSKTVNSSRPTQTPRRPACYTYNAPSDPWTPTDPYDSSWSRAPSSSSPSTGIAWWRYLRLARSGSLRITNGATPTSCSSTRWVSTLGGEETSLLTMCAIGDIE